MSSSLRISKTFFENFPEEKKGIAILCHSSFPVKFLNVCVNRDGPHVLKVSATVAAVMDSLDHMNHHLFAWKFKFKFNA